MSHLLKVIWYFVNYLFLYFTIGILACFLSFAFWGMIFGAPSVFIISAVVLSFYLTAGRCIQGDLLIDRSYYWRALIEEGIIISAIIVIIVFIYFIAIIGK